jgi:hypothetical protein
MSHGNVNPQKARFSAFSGREPSQLDSIRAEVPFWQMIRHHSRLSENEDLTNSVRIVPVPLFFSRIDRAKDRSSGPTFRRKKYLKSMQAEACISLFTDIYL